MMIWCKHDCQQLPCLSSKQLFPYFNSAKFNLVVTHLFFYLVLLLLLYYTTPLSLDYCCFSNIERLCLLTTAASLIYNASVSWLLLLLWLITPLSLGHCCFFILQRLCLLAITAISTVTSLIYNAFVYCLPLSLPFFL